MVLYGNARKNGRKYLTAKPKHKKSKTKVQNSKKSAKKKAKNIIKVFKGMY